MTSCELCGNETSSVTKIKLEGTKLKVCDDCSNMGKEIGTSKRKKSGGSSSSRSPKKRNRNNQKVLDPEFGEVLKSAREERDMTQQDLADKLNEKTSRISKMERSELKPDENLAKKLEKELGVNLYVNPEVSDHDTGSNPDNRSATLGDVADVKD